MIRAGGCIVPPFNCFNASSIGPSRCPLACLKFFDDGQISDSCHLRWFHKAFFERFKQTLLVVKLAELALLADLVEPATFKTVLRFYHEQAGCKANAFTDQSFKTGTGSTIGATR